MPRRSGYVRIDISDVIDEIDDDDLLEEIKHRKLIVAGDAQDFMPMDDLVEAYAELLRGRASEAMAILDRIIHPKWGSMKLAQAELARALSLTQGNQNSERN